jgi:hypothetical protein
MGNLSASLKVTQTKGDGRSQHFPVLHKSTFVSNPVIQLHRLGIGEDEPHSDRRYGKSHICTCTRMDSAHQ